jgi:hypothetical protein
MKKGENQMTYEEAVEQEKQTRAFIRAWVLRKYPKKQVNTTSGEYEILHQCIREVYAMEDAGIIKINSEIGKDSD